MGGMMPTNLLAHRIELPLRTPISTGHGAIAMRPTILLECRYGDAIFWSEIPAFSHAGYGPTHAEMWALLAKEGPAIARAMANGALADQVRALRHSPMLCHAVDALHVQVQAFEHGQSLMGALGIAPRPVDGRAMVGLHSSPNTLITALEAVHKAGYSAVKLKLSPHALPTVLAALPQALALFDEVVLDANGTFTADDWPALFDLPQHVVLEQPTHDLDLHTRQPLPNPVMLDEAVTGVADVAVARDFGAGVMLKPVTLGPMSDTLAIIDECHALGVPCGISGHLDSGVGRYLQWVLAQHPKLSVRPDFVWSDYYFSDDVLMITPSFVDTAPLAVDYGRFCRATCAF